MKIPVVVFLLFLPFKSYSFFLHLDGMSQGEFNSLCEELSVLSSLSETGGFDSAGWSGISMTASIVGMDIRPSHTYWRKALGNSGPDILPLLRFELEKGFPFSLDAGIHLTSLPGSQFQLTGGWIEYEMMREGIFRPSFTTRFSFSGTIFSVSPYLYTLAAEGGVSKRKAGFLYYGGFGVFYSKADAKGFSDVEFFRVKGKMGITFFLRPFTLTLQVDISSIFLYTMGFGGSFIF